MNKDNQLTSLQIDEIQLNFPSVSKRVIENELAKNEGDFNKTMTSIKKINQSIADVDLMLGEEEKEYKIKNTSDKDSSDDAGTSNFSLQRFLLLVH